MRIVADSAGPAGVFGNLNYVRVLPSPRPAGPAPFGGTARSLPGKVEAEDFDEGGEGVAYHDTTAENVGAEYRATGVDVQKTEDDADGYNVGWMRVGEWLNYTVSVRQGGTYTLVARVAAEGPGGTFHIEFGGIDRTGPMSIPDTGSWQGFTDIAATISLDPGVQSMRIVADSSSSAGVFGNINHVTLMTR